MTEYRRDTLVRADVFGESDVLLTYADPEDADQPWVRVSGDSAGHWIQADGVENVRPLFVVDLSGVAFPAERLANIMETAAISTFMEGSQQVRDINYVAQQIREQAMGPRMPEPKGRYAVVRDKHGHDWNRRGVTQHSSCEWVNLQTGDSWDWQHIEEPTLVFGGIEEDE